MENENVITNEKVKVPMSRSTKRRIFFWCAAAIPLALFVVFYVYVVLQSFVYAFQKYTSKVGEIGWDISFAGLDNFKRVILMLQTGDNMTMVYNSLRLGLLKICIGTFISMIFSYYVYKKLLFSGFFRVVLFMPSIISGLIMVLLFRYVANDVYKVIFNKQLGLLSDPATTYATILVYVLWLGFAGEILMYTSAMGGINESVVESAQIDGVNVVQEMIFITMPMIYPTVVTFIVAQLAAMFTDQMSLYTFYGSSAPISVQTVGYMLYRDTLSSGKVPNRPWNEVLNSGVLSFAELTAFGLMISIVMVPITFLIRNLLQKFGPSAD